MTRLLLTCAFAILFATAASAGERNFKPKYPSYTNGNGHHHSYKHHKKPPRVPELAPERLSFGCGKAYAVGSNCYDPMAGFDGPRFLDVPLNTLGFLPEQNPVNHDGVVDAETLVLDGGRIVLR